MVSVAAQMPVVGFLRPRLGIGGAERLVLDLRRRTAAHAVHRLLGLLAVLGRHVLHLLGHLGLHGLPALLHPLGVGLGQLVVRLLLVVDDEELLGPGVHDHGVAPPAARAPASHPLHADVPGFEHHDGGALLAVAGLPLVGEGHASARRAGGQQEQGRGDELECAHAGSFNPRRAGVNRGAARPGPRPPRPAPAARPPDSGPARGTARSARRRWSRCPR